MAEKQRQFVLLSGGEIVWLVGRRIDDRYRLTPTRRTCCVSPKESSDMAKSVLKFKDSVAAYEQLAGQIAARRFVPVYLLMGRREPTSSTPSPSR